MQMIHVVTSANQHLYARQLDQMFRLRHAYYIEGHGWAGLTSQDGRETDEFDDTEAIYLMGIDPFGEVAVSVRLNPTTGPTLLKKFSSWADQPTPSGEDIWDVSRWMAQPRHRRANNPRWPTNFQRELMTGMLEFCESRGLTRLTMLAELRLTERIESYGWPVRRLGQPQIYEGGKGSAIAAEIEVGAHVMALTRQKTGVFGHVLFELNPDTLPSPAIERASVSRDLEILVADHGVEPVRKIARALTQLLVVEGESVPGSLEALTALENLIAAAAPPHTSRLTAEPARHFTA
jgi:acyl-homoserine lactone synthase